MTFMTTLHLMEVSVLIKINFCKLVTYSCYSPNLIVLLMLINLIPCITYFMTALHLMEVSMLTKVNFLGLENFCMLGVTCNLPVHADRFDVLHDLLQHCHVLHGHARGHQD